MSSSIHGFLKPSAPVKWLTSYPYVEAEGELAGYSVGSNNHKAFLILDDSELVTPELPPEVEQHVAFYLLTDETVGLTLVQGEHVTDDAVAMVKCRPAYDEDLVTRIRIRAISAAKAIQLRSDILAGRRPTLPYRTAPKSL